MHWPWVVIGSWRQPVSHTPILSPPRVQGIGINSGDIPEFVLVAEVRSEEAGACRHRGGLPPIGRTEFGEDMGDGSGDRLAANKELLGDLAVGPALTKEGEDFLLAVREIRWAGKCRGLPGEPSE